MKLLIPGSIQIQSLHMLISGSKHHSPCRELSKEKRMTVKLSKYIGLHLLTMLLLTRALARLYGKSNSDVAR